MHQATTVSGLGYGRRHYRVGCGRRAVTGRGETFFLIHPNDVLCFASVPSTEMEEGVDCGKYKTRGTTTHPFFSLFFIKHTKKNKDDKRE